MTSTPLPSFTYDTKTPSPTTDISTSPADPPASKTMLSRTPSSIARMLVSFCFVGFLYYVLFGAGTMVVSDGVRIIGEEASGKWSIERELVPLEAHIMSKCPDAKDCLKLMVLPTMQRVIEKVNFTLSFIGTPTDNDGVECMHGPDECMGNIIELCAAKLYPNPKTSLGFTMCLTRDFRSIPQKSLVEDCALEHGIDFDKLEECTIEDNGGTGMGLLRDSVRRSTQAGVTKSCTVRLDNEVYCIRDGGKWSDCPNGPGVNDLVIAVEKLYQSASS